MPYNNGNNEYVLKASEVRDRAKADGIKIKSIDGGLNERAGCFYSPDVTINGRQTKGYEYHSSGFMDGEKETWKQKAGAISNSYCPDCGAQGYHTDHPNIASCGAYPGWFYYFKEHEDEQKTTTEDEYIIKIVNGQYVRVRKPKIIITNERK